MAKININDININNFYNHLYDKVNYKGKELTVGRYIVSKILGDKYIEKFGVIDYAITSSTIKKIISNLTEIYSPEELSAIIYRLRKISYIVSTVKAPSFKLSDVMIYEKLDKYRVKLDKTTNLNKKIKIINNMKSELEKIIKNTDNGFKDFMLSGSGLKLVQLLQLLGAKGVITNISNEIAGVIEQPLALGLKPTDMFLSAKASRKGMGDRSLNTAELGYLERKLVYALSTVILSRDVKDCGTKRTLDIIMSDDIRDRLDGRYIVGKDGKPKLLTKEMLNKIPNGRKIKLRSPIYCKSPEICHTCYGELYKILETRNIGIVAATNIGERGTQTIMRTFHVGAGSSLSHYDYIELFYKNQSMYPKQTYEKLFKQTEHILKALKPGKIYLRIENSFKNYVEIDNDGNIIIPYLNGYYEIEVNGEAYKIPLNAVVVTKIYNLSENATTEFNSKNLTINIIIDKGGIDIMEEIPQIVNVSLNLAQMRASLSKTRENPDILFTLMEIFDKYKDSSDMDFVHFEVVISALARNKDNPFIPARLVEPYEPVIYGLKKIPYFDDYKLGLQFENIENAIYVGIVERKMKEIIKEQHGIEKPKSPLVRI